MKKVLLIEKDAFLTGIYASKLEDAGYATESSDSLEEGLIKAKDGKPDIIVVDIDISEEGGLNLLKELKKTDSTKKTPVMVFSNMGDEAHFKKAQECGIDAYLVKSQYTSNEVVAEVKKILSRFNS